MTETATHAITEVGRVNLLNKADLEKKLEELKITLEPQSKMAREMDKMGNYEISAQLHESALRIIHQIIFLTHTLRTLTAQYTYNFLT